ncbi:hypothetical protein GGX14DRAFT_581647 [Mycena pura]|uniref:Uncharacterized protein n=1 Tax=Mycena pura TaxID=153505 RepID=A0AAD6YV56_9AGAR|nr:hypothetical protein GGX14DRAFT_581647 [Mycena pura]
MRIALPPFGFFLHSICTLHATAPDRHLLQPAQLLTHERCCPSVLASIRGELRLNTAGFVLITEDHVVFRAKYYLLPGSCSLPCSCLCSLPRSCFPPNAVLITAAAVLRQQPAMQGAARCGRIVEWRIVGATAALITAATALLIAALPLPPCHPSAAAHASLPPPHACEPPLRRARRHPVRARRRSVCTHRSSRTCTPPGSCPRVLTAAPAHDDAHIAATEVHVATPYVHVAAHAAAPVRPAPLSPTAAPTRTLHQMAQSRLCDRAPIVHECGVHMALHPTLRRTSDVAEHLEGVEIGVVRESRTARRADGRGLLLVVSVNLAPRPPAPHAARSPVPRASASRARAPARAATTIRVSPRAHTADAAPHRKLTPTPGLQHMTVRYVHCARLAATTSTTPTARAARCPPPWRCLTSLKARRLLPVARCLLHARVVQDPPPQPMLPAARVCPLSPAARACRARSQVAVRALPTAARAPIARARSGEGPSPATRAHRLLHAAHTSRKTCRLPFTAFFPVPAARRPLCPTRRTIPGAPRCRHASSVSRVI